MPKVKENLKRTLEIHIRVSPDEKKKLSKDAKPYRSEAEYVRHKLFIETK